jgi:hypothetical protein
VRNQDNGASVRSKYFTMTTVDAPTMRQSGAGGQKLWLIFTGLMLALLLGALDQNIVATALPRIVSDLGGLFG